MLLKFPLVLENLEIPKLSTLVSSKLSLYRAPTFAKNLTEKYRACIRHALQMSSKVLKIDEKQKLNFLFDNLRVYSIEKLYVAFQVHEESMNRRQPFHWDEHQCVLVVEGDSSINMKALVKLLPAGSNDTLNLEYIFTASAIQAWLKDHPVIIQNLPSPQWNLLNARPGFSPASSPSKPSSSQTTFIASKTTTSLSNTPSNRNGPALGQPASNQTTASQGFTTLAPKNLDSSPPQANIPQGIKHAEPDVPAPDQPSNNNNSSHEQEYLEDITQSLEDYEYIIHHQSPDELISQLKKSAETQQQQPPNQPIQNRSRSKSFDAALMQIENKDALLIGQLAEAFVWLRLRQLVPHISPSSWISSNRATLLPTDTSQANDGAGFDFEYRDGSFTYRIEVKGHLTEHANGFHFSENERRKAQECHNSPNMKYIIIGVAIIPQPQVIYTLSDPIQLADNKQLKMTPSQYMVSDFDRKTQMDNLFVRPVFQAPPANKQAPSAASPAPKSSWKAPAHQQPKKDSPKQPKRYYKK
mmetsp:Transcript_20734/g.29111  ORF Transcript_20734/g.29111 Transcript_20734/m.29111 type:complete len:526 (+) Transcript_20734:2-1579(+)